MATVDRPAQSDGAAGRWADRRSGFPPTLPAWQLTHIATPCYERLALPASVQGDLRIDHSPNVPSEPPTKVARAYQAFSMSSVGLEMGLCVLIGWGIGYFVDKEYGSAPYGTLIFLGVGVVAGFKALFRAARQAKRAGEESKE